jgi:DNA-directed RNA polymerase subunit M/transcription elongation factor TFIIS
MENTERIKESLVKRGFKGEEIDYLTYELIYSDDPFEEIQNNPHTTATEFILGMKKMNKYVKNLILQDDLYNRPSSFLEGSVRCIYCKGNNTLTSSVQTRSSDEAPTKIGFCNSCRKSFNPERAFEN